MILKSGYRFSEKIMLKQSGRAAFASWNGGSAMEGFPWLPSNTRA